MKKIRVISKVLVVLIFIQMITNNLSYLKEAKADEIQKYNGLQYKIVSEEAIIVGCDGTLEDITIPKTINGYKVRYIGNYAFRGCTKIKNLRIESDIVSIGNSAFEGCCELIDLVVPKSTMFIGKAAFKDCVNLQKITIPGNIIEISSKAFYNCVNIDEINIEGDIKYIGEYAFFNCSKLVNINIPNSIKKIGKSAFYNCLSLNSINIEGDIDKLEENTFANCSSLESIHIPSTVKSIGNKCFYECSNLNNIRIDNGVEGIGSKAFAKCSNLGYVELPDSVNIIGSKAFSDCSKLCGVVIPKTVTNIGTDLFINSDNAKIYAESNTMAERCGEYITASVVQELVFQEEQIEINVGETAKVEINYVPSEAQIGKNVSYISSDENIALIDNNGAITGNQVGTVEITAKNTRGITSKCIVNVVNKELAINKYGVNEGKIGVVGRISTLSIDASGSENLSYSFEVTKDGKSIYYREYSDCKTAKWTPTEVGTYKIYYKVKDCFSNEVCKTMEYKVNNIKLMTKIESPQKIGTRIVITALFNKAVDAKYKFEVIKNGNIMYSRKFTDANYTRWTPTQEGEYVIKATIQDENNDEYVEYEKFCVINEEENENYKEKQLKLDFEDINYMFNKDWTIYGGTWSLHNNQLKAESGGGYKAIVTDKYYNNFICELDVTTTSKQSDGDIGLAFRIDDASYGGFDSFYGYYVGVYTNQYYIKLGKMNYDWSPIIASNMEVVDNTKYHIKVIAIDNHITVYVDNNEIPIIDSYDSDYYRGMIGLRVFKKDAYYDNIVITDLGGSQENILEEDTSFSVFREKLLDCSYNSINDINDILIYIKENYPELWSNLNYDKALELGMDMDEAELINQLNTIIVRNGYVPIKVDTKMILKNIDSGELLQI